MVAYFTVMFPLDIVAHSSGILFVVVVIVIRCLELLWKI